MIFDILTPPKGSRGRGQKNCAVARPIDVSNSHTKIGWILSNGIIVGDSITDGQAEVITISASLFLKRGDNNRIYVRILTWECDTSN